MSPGCRPDHHDLGPTVSDPVWSYGTSAYIHAFLVFSGTAEEVGVEVEVSIEVHELGLALGTWGSTKLVLHMVWILLSSQRKRNVMSSWIL